MACVATVILLAWAVVSVHRTGCQGLTKPSSPLRFTHYLYNASIKENSAPRTHVESPVRMGVLLSDPFWDIKYKIVAGDADALFKVEEFPLGDFCFLRIKTRSGNAALLNREVRDSYTLTVEATESTFDHQARTKVSIQVQDTNDLKPLFYPASYNVVVREDAPLRSSVVRVSATDADLGSNAEFYYSFTTRSHPFAVDPFTGTITLVKKLNANQRDRFDLTVLAEDRTKKISGVQKFGNVARVGIKVERVERRFSLIAPPSVEAPQTGEERWSVDVNTEPWAQPGLVSLSITAGDPQGWLHIVPSSLQAGGFQLVSTKRINWSQNPYGLNISLQAKDRSNPPLLTPVKHIHLVSPQSTPTAFVQEIYRVTLSEFSPPKSFVAKVSVQPSSSNVTFHIKDNSDGDTFRINAQTGIIVTSEHLDFEKQSHFEFDVAVSGTNNLIHVIVDVTDENDNTPKFTLSSYQAVLPENVPVGTSILAVSAVDLDQDNNGFVTYAIANTAPLPFIIDPFTGVISTSEEFDYELMERRYHLRVWASDSGSPFSNVRECAVTITLTNINDNVPLFEKLACNATIPHNFAVRKTIAEIQAVDLDELEQLRYEIVSGNTNALFEIDPLSGTIMLAKPIPADVMQMDNPSYTLKVVATDGRYSSETTSVSVRVTGEGKEATTRCQEKGVFKELTDRLIESIKPSLTVQEEELFSDVHIINRHSPKFSLSVPSTIEIQEDFALNTPILAFKATDDDSGFNGKLVYAISSGNEDGCFTINVNTGELTIVCPLDREAKEFYILNITVYDLGTPQNTAWKFLAVTVLDVNDNAPLFDQPRYVLNISESTVAGTSIFQVRARDFDSDDNGIIKYSLLSFTELFQMDEVTGEVRVTGRLDRETFTRYDLKIEARDRARAGPQLFSVAEVVVILDDINDNPPRFTPKVYQIKVLEDVPPGTVLLWVESHDLDLGSGGLISYNLKNSEKGLFFLDTSTGLLTLEKELDFERKDFYNLTVRAVDHGQPQSLSSSCFIEVEVLDVNENLNRPVFTSFVYNAPVMEDAVVGTSVLTLTANDADLGKDGVVKYHIQDGTGLGVFTIDEETGVVQTADALDREVSGHYWLTVFAYDLGSVPLSSRTEVYIEVLDVNDNPPELSQPIYFASILENQPKDQPVLQLAATDADKSSEGKLSFQILESQRTYFNINPKTGVVSSLAGLDRELKAEHTLEVVVSDNGAPALSSTATVIVQVLDENDNSPRFSHKLFQVRLPARRATDPPQDVYRMLARDEDEGEKGKLTYSVDDSMGGLYDIHPTTGVVTTTAAFSPGNYSILTITATDGGTPVRTSKARLDVEWLPEPEPSPDALAFDDAHFTFAVMETEPVTEMVGLISTEITQGPLLFDIVGGDEDQDFYIEKNTGSIVIAKRLDAGKKSNYNLTVQVTDGSQTISTQAYIRVLDMNEHRPMFSKTLYKVRVPEDTAPWKEILEISAQDADTNSRLVYSIHSSLHPDSLKHFQLELRSGKLILTEELDFEEISMHTLIVMVRDQDIPVKKNFVKVIVHVEDCNDHTPTFMSTRYEGRISNLAPAGTPVLTVKALDKDKGSNAEIVYSFHSGNVDGAFEINQESGLINVAKVLDSLPQDQYHLTVKATDQGFPQRSDLCPVSIHVKLSGRTPPRFSAEEFFTEISEAGVVGTPIFSVSARCPSAVQYRITDGDADGNFHINPNSGLLSVKKTLDFEERESYRLKIRATSTTGGTSDAVVYVYVIDENDNAPAFLQEEYHGQISEAAHINSMIMGQSNTPLVIMATDEDKDSNALLVFQILEPEAQEVFQIDPSTGTISLASEVDFEATAEFQFSIQVQDSGEPSLSAAKPSKVIIHVLDFNDCPPRFTAPAHSVSITLPVFKDMEVTQIVAHDQDSEVFYTITEGNLKNAFAIHPSTGVVSINNISDFQSNYELKVTAADGLYKDTAVLKVNISETSQSSLKFEEQLHAVTVLENTSVVKTLALLRAKGSYLNEPLIYSVLNPGDKFAMVQSSGVFQTTGVAFDREEQDEYDVVVEVKDMRSPPRRAVTHVRVYVDDVNDNAPALLNLPDSITISEETEPGDVFYQVLANDNDTGENGSIIFRLIDDFDLFRIDQYLGDVSLQRPLDFQSMNRYVLTVLASDEGAPSLSTVAELHVQTRNRSHPIFQSLFYPLKLPENIAPFTTILHVQARNPEGYHIIYNLEEENASRNFHIEFKTGVLSVTDYLDYETQTKHLLTVRATDSVTGSFTDAKVEIEVEDVNDNAPVFQNLTYLAYLAENLPAGTPVLQISAVDRDSGRNGLVSYQIFGTGKNETDFFEIDPVTGLLVTKQVLDYESTQQFHLKVRATDSGGNSLSSEARVTVNVADVNDNPPNFSSPDYQASLDEMASCGHIVIKVQASDPDSKDDLQYKILSGNEGRHFAINESSGLISFSNVCKRNMDPFYNLTVAVSDGVFQKTAPVNIDMTNGNNHSPHFNQDMYEAELAENAQPGTRVIRLAAIDPDDGPYGSVDYTIINKLADEKFTIDSEGQIVTSKPLDRENPQQRVIAVKVMAKDGGGRVAFCTVKIILTDENDNVPQFKASEYHVSIQSTINKGAPVIQIMAYDADDGKNADVTYTVDEAEEVTEELIEINPFTGVVSVKESLVGLENKIFHFKVQARDGGTPFHNSTVPLQVNVVSPEVPLPRFTEPLYTFSAAEDLPVGYEIGTVKADAEMPLIYSLVDGNTVESNKDKVFVVDKDSGTLVVQKNIDHEKTKWYQIDVVAQGNHNGTAVASLVSVSIQVQDVNDNQPVFEANPYQAFLAENLPPGTTVIQVTANDPDTDRNGEVTYRVEPGPDDISEVFTIDSESGWITTLKQMDCEAKQLYKFYVVATDNGSKVKMSSSVTVEVTVTDENDNPPKFLEELHQGSIIENSRPGEPIVTLTTTDKDVSAENRQVTCYITDGDPLGQFAVSQHGDEWKVTLRGSLDRETKDKHTLQIIATDGLFQAPATVDIHVLDINDNSPLCEQLVYTEAVMENSPSGLFILKVSASDPDIGTNGQVSFTLHGPDADKFHLDPRTGELFTLDLLDRERETEYDLVVKATDGGGRSCQADVTLMVQDTNDNPPSFPSNHYEVTVFDNTTVRTPIAVLYARDPDTGINSEVRYSLQGPDSGFFSLDEISGILRLERFLADETQSTFQLRVKATDRGLPRHLSSIATVTVQVVDLSDYQPVFLSSEYGAQIPESTAVGTEVLSVSALTKEGTGVEPVTYSIVAGNTDGRFLMDPQTGALTLNAALDFEVCREYYLSVEGTRGRASLSDIATVTINVTDVNDNPPAFSHSDYSAEVAEETAPGDLVSQVLARDPDGPLNSLIVYSIVSGDPRQQFSIDPRGGQIRVRSMLDREETPHYSLTVQAADQGEPPLSTAVQVTVTVTDVNDNPPVFSQIHHELLLQEAEAVGSGILQLVVTDRDTPRNGPPFSFHIVSGNEDRSFHIDQGGLLSVSSPLRSRAKPRHILKIQVTDSGRPPLSSICVVRINVTEQSRYPPTVAPLEVYITTAEGQTFSRHIVGKLHATDQDLHDTLSYRLLPELPAGNAPFSVDPAEGMVVAERPPEPGLYSLNVSVSDGRFTVWAGVRVHVWEAEQPALDRGVTLELAGLSAEEFVSECWRGLQRSLAAQLGFPRQELHIASLQETLAPPALEVLLVRRTAEGAWRAVPAQRLAGAVADMEEALGLSFLGAKHDGCGEPGCPPRGCRNAVVLSEGTISHYATARASFITPRHSWESACSCNESAVEFDGSGYLKYLYQLEEKQDFLLSLRLRTQQADGMIMTTNTTDWGTLQLVDRALQFTYHCGKASHGRLQLQRHPVSDGGWHHVSLEVNGTALRLTLDRTHSDSVTLSEPCRLSRPRGALVFAGPRAAPPAPAPGLAGCLDNLRFNGEWVRLEAGAGGGRVYGVYQCCSRDKSCSSSPCANGGTCQEGPDGGFRCSCPPQFHGHQCELDNPCALQPCAHGGQCVPKAKGYVCRCPPQEAGSRCQMGSCSPDSCPSEFHCTVAVDSFFCEPLPQVSRDFGYVEIAALCAGALCLLLLVGAFVGVRKRYVSQRKHKPVCVQDSNGYFHTGVTKSMAGEVEDTPPIEMSSLIGLGNDLDHSPFRSLKPQEQREMGPRAAPQAGRRIQRAPGPVVCSVAPNLPAPPSSNSDNESVRKGQWDLDYEVYPADPDYFGRPSVQEFPQFDIGQSSYPPAAASDSRRNSRFGGFPFPLERSDKRAPLPPCYSNQNLDDFLGADGQPLPSSQCPNEYTAISYYPAQHARSLDNVSGGNAYRPLSMRLSVAQPSYAEGGAQGEVPRRSRSPRSYTGSDLVESDYGSCEEVMF